MRGRKRYWVNNLTSTTNNIHQSPVSSTWALFHIYHDLINQCSRVFISYRNFYIGDSMVKIYKYKLINFFFFI